MIAPGAAALAAVESFFSAGVTVAPLPDAFGTLGGVLFRYLPALQDDWSGGLHLDAEPDEVQFAQVLSTWRAFDSPGRLRWPGPRGAAISSDVLEAVAAEGLLVASRPVFAGVASAASASPTVPTGVTIEPIAHDVKDWAGFEVLARWIDLDVDPDRWKWRAKRVRHLVEGGRGRAWLARTPTSPVGACVLLDPPAHRVGASPAVGVVVHQAHRRKAVARALLDTAVATVAGPVTLLGDGQRRLQPPIGLGEVSTLVEVRRPIDGADRKA